jgi:alkane 1-monooxygenase
VVRHARYLLMNLLLAANALALWAGGGWTWANFLGAVALASVVDEAAGDDRTAGGGAPERLLDLLLLTLPLVALNVALLAVRAGSESAFGLAGAILGLGLLTGAAATNVAHELTHRLDRPISMAIGRWLLAFSFDTAFSIEHVHGHHRNVGTPAIRPPRGAAIRFSPSSGAPSGMAICPLGGSSATVWRAAVRAC